ncbi:MAG TPA: hypothetical protein VHV08_11640, partial [Pirellulales bacterium]|nr:hypothetical protein [Pirellulales bacterium]
ARLLGRLAWKASGSPAGLGGKEDAESSWPRKRGREGRARIQFPDELDAAASMLAERPPGRRVGPG